MIGLWPTVEGDELHSSRYMQVMFNTLSDYAESLKLITGSYFVSVALSEKMNSVSLVQSSRARHAIFDADPKRFFPAIRNHG